MNKAGFGLIEAVIAVVIIGGVGIAAMATLSTHIDLAYRTRIHIEATALAEYKLNELGVGDRATLSQLAGQELTGRFELPFHDYRWNAHISRDATLPDVFNASVVVRWTDDDSLALGTAFHRP